MRSGIANIGARIRPGKGVPGRPSSLRSQKDAVSVEPPFASAPAASVIGLSDDLGVAGTNLCLSLPS